MMRVEVREHERRRLRMLATQRRRELLRVGLAQAMQPRRVGELRLDATQDLVGALAAVDALEHLARVLQTARRERRDA